MKSAAMVLALATPVFLAGCQESSERAKTIEEEVGGLKARIERLEKGQAAIGSRLDEVKDFLQVRAPKRVAFKEAVFDIGDDPFRGSENALVTLVDFTDVE
jgi:hypothetical protein